MRSIGTTLVLAVALGTGACAAHRAGPETTTTTTLPAEGGQQVVITESPAASPSARGAVNHRLLGEVTDVERGRGEVTVRTTDGSRLTLRLPPMATAAVREGDAVSVDVVVTPRER
ncbi:MAG TPA: hypothetical protein VNK50_05600 [Calidithermus sp.]|nr:hypothetical protein [Calidithermus sp.]